MASPDLSYAFGEITAEERDRLIAERERERLKNSFVPTSAADFEKEVDKYFIDDNARFFTWHTADGAEARFLRIQVTKKKIIYALSFRKTPSGKWKEFKHSTIQDLFNASYTGVKISDTFINQRVRRFIFHF